LLGVWKLIWSAFICFSSFYFVRELVAFAGDKSKPDWVGWVLSVSFFIACIIISVTLQQMSSKAAQVGVRIRAAMLSAVFRKATKLDIQDLVAGDVVNLATNDCSRLMDSTLAFHYLWSGAVEAAVIIVLLCILMGVSGVPAIGVIFVLLVLQLIFGYAISALRNKNINITDARVTIMTEVLQAIKLVKLYSWEQFFSDHVNKVLYNTLILTFFRFEAEKSF
jgi:ABC-type multidrug transport system fused ATPase/permease subunit